jgi:hypothetical protein
MSFGVKIDSFDGVRKNETKAQGFPECSLGNKLHYSRATAWLTNIVIIAAPSIKFLGVRGGVLITALIVLATRGVMEILGLVPYQSQTQYLDENLRVIGRGNIVEKYFRFVSSSFPLPVVFTGRVEI